jgi:Fe2+ transport system protein FeoA
LTLATVREGSEVTVRAVNADVSQSRRLREMGLLEGRTLRVVSNHDPLICRVDECRFGLCRRLARCVMVEPVPAAALPSP